MIKKGPLSKKEKTVIDAEINTIGVAKLAEKLGRSESMIEKYRSTITTNEEPTKEQPTTSAGNDLNLYARNKNRGVVIMTESASMAADESKKAKDIYNTRKYRNVIHKFKEE